MRYSDIIMLSLRALFGKISREAGFPETDIFCGIENSIAKIARATLFHVGISVCQVPGLVCRRGQSRISKDLVGRTEARKITNLRQDHGAHAKTHARNRCNGRLQLRENRLDLFLNLRNLIIQSANQSNHIPQFKGFGSAHSADRSPCGLPDLDDFFLRKIAGGYFAG